MKAPLDTMPADLLPPLTDEWLEEVRQRSAQYELGSVQTVPWEQVRADTLRRIEDIQPKAAK